MYALLLFFSAAQCMHNKEYSDEPAHSPQSALIGFVALHLCQLVAHGESHFPGNTSRRHHWLSATSTQQIVLLAAEFRHSASQRSHGIWGTQ